MASTNSLVCAKSECAENEMYSTDMRNGAERPDDIVMVSGSLSTCLASVPSTT